MKIKILDFGLLTKHYKKYQESVDIIEKEKKDLLKEIKPLQDKINLHIMNSVDDSEVLLLNQEILNKEKNFKIKVKEISDETNLICYQEIIAFVEKWAKLNDIDIVLSSTEVVFSKIGIESTEEILELFKMNNLFVN